MNLRQHPDLHLSFESTSLIAGETLRVTLEPGAPLGAPLSLELSVLWLVEGGEGMEHLVFFKKVEPPPPAGTQVAIEMTLPLGPWSYSGEVFQILWLARASVRTAQGVVATDALLQVTGKPRSPLPPNTLAGC